MLYTKVQPQNLTGSGEDFLSFLPYVGIVPLCSVVQNRMNKFTMSLLQKAPCEI